MQLISEIFLILHSTLRLGWRLLLAVPAEGWVHVWKRLPLFILLWLAHTALNLLHILGHLIDELIFFSYRNTRVSKPVFIIGVPRSGTTLLQRIIAEDEDFTTLQTWEALLAPSITERYLFSFIGFILTPFAAVIIRIRRILLRRMDSIHEIRVRAAEEDFILLLPLDACFLLVLLCPNCEHYWRLAAFDGECDENYRRRVMGYYHRCLKKHLYFHGAGLRLLSKNPSFTPFIDSLRHEFPDANFIGCVRPPEEVIPSQLNSLGPAMHLLGSGRCSAVFENRLIEVLQTYYARISQFMQDTSFVILPLHDLKNHLRENLENLFACLDMPVSDNFARRLEIHAAGARAYQSHYQQQSKKLSLQEQEIQQKFRPVWPLKNNLHGELS